MLPLFVRFSDILAENAPVGVLYADTGSNQIHAAEQDVGTAQYLLLGDMAQGPKDQGKHADIVLRLLEGGLELHVSI